MKNICNRCTGSAYLEHKNLLAPSSLACEDAKWKNYLMSRKDGQASF
jgi:ribosomal protein L33